MCRAVALLVAAGVTASAHAAGIVNLGAATPRASGSAAGLAGIGATTNLGITPAAALQASQPSIRNLGNTAQAIAAQIAAQNAAAAAAANTLSNVPNGLAAGGLQVAPGASSGTGNPLLWVNANAPTQSVDGSGHVTVDVRQTAQNAVLTWQTMNVGRQTTLNFDQSGGTQGNGANNWAVLNRVVDPSGAPSQILGSITAQGAVYVINRNGILFGAGSQINVHSLVASSLDLLNLNDYNQTVLNGKTVVADSTLGQDAAGIVASNLQFLGSAAGTTGGLAPGEAGSTGNTTGATNLPTEVLGLGNQINLTSASQYRSSGDVTIQPGASITTHTNGTAGDGGFVMIAAPNVTNAGSITATDGQVVLAAGAGVSLRPNPNAPQILLPELSGAISLIDPSTGAASDITPVGLLVNTGIVQASRGNVTLLGGTVNQNGVVGVTTSVNTPGTITISTVDEYAANNALGAAYQGQNQITIGTTGAPGDITHRAGLLTFGPDSVTTVLADTNGQTATSAPGTTFTPGSITMTAGSAWFQGGSLIEAPGSTVSVAALVPQVTGYNASLADVAVPGRIYLDNNATIDVSGLANVELPISSILLTIPRIGQNELADSPLLRDGFLFGQTNVVVDGTLTGTRGDGVQWIGSPILNLAGYASLIPRTVSQLLTNGGTIVLSGNEVMTAAGSSLNLNGGYVHYDGGIVNTTRLVDANGAIVPIGQANPNDIYVGIAGEFTESHPRWGVTKTWYNTLQSGGGVYEPDFIVGGNAGTLDVYAASAAVLDGGVSAQAFGGAKQTLGDSLPDGGTFNLGADAALSQSIIGRAWNNLPIAGSGMFGLVILQDQAPRLDALSPNFSASTALDSTALGALSSTDPNNVLATTVVPTATLTSGGFSKLDVTEDKNAGKGFVVAEGSQLKLQPGGSITLNNPTMTGGASVLGDLIVPGGSISITTGGDIVVGPQATLGVAGQWVNNDVQASPATATGSSETINGGSITLTSIESSALDGSGQVVDTSGSIVLKPGSVLDLSGGGMMQGNGQLLMQNGVAEGQGGSLALRTYYQPLNQQFGQNGSSVSGAALPSSQPTAGRIEMNGTILSEGFSGGGTLTLQGLGFQIGGDPAAAPAWSLYLPANFFARQGFGKYVLNAFYDSTIAPGTTLALTQRNLIPDAAALQSAASGADLLAGGLTRSGVLDAYHRQPTDLVLTAGNDTAWQTSGLSPTIPSYAGVTGAVTVSAGASIVADAGASVGLGSPRQVTVLGSIVAPGGSITLSADTNATGSFAQTGELVGGGVPGNGRSVWLGPDAVLDVSGAALANPLAAPARVGSATIQPDTGKVLPGGSVTLSSDHGYVVAQAGSIIDVSGAAAPFDEPQAGGGYASQNVWSNAGSITLGAGYGLFADATLSARGGAAQAAGGTLTILPQQSNNAASATALVIRQSGELTPVGLAAGQSFATAIDPTTGLPIGSTPNGVIQFAADRLDGSGIANLVLGNGAASSVTAPVPPIVFAGDVTLSLPGSVTLNTDRIAALNMGQLSTLLSTPALPPGGSTVLTTMLGQSTRTPIGTTVEINAPYVALMGPPANTNAPPFTPVAALSDATLNVNAAFIDLSNQVQLNNFGQANFTSSGDIRLSSTKVSGSSGGNGLAPGVLYSPGNLTFTAADLYPATGGTYIIDATGPTDASTGQPVPTTVTFASNGASGTPLSAGGSLLVDATDIVQGGTVRVPSGTLVLGVGDPTDGATQTLFGGLAKLVATDSVRLTNGSVTSVSNDGLVIPYGTTVDGVEYQFNPVAGVTGPDLAAPPAKYIGINASNVSLEPGAKIDLSGGGDLRAVEWVPGTGGTRDVLSQYSISYANASTGTAVPVNVGGTNVYAIVPGTQAPVATYDPVYAQSTQPTVNGNGTAGITTASLGVGQAGTGDVAGKSVYLSGVPGLPAGYYTLLPARYATLPGAFRVTVSSASGTAIPGATQTLADGTVVTTGYFANSVTGSRSATPTVFNVQSNATWEQYSQYTLTGANSFFASQAASKGGVTPPSPVDGGQLVLAATRTLALGAALNAAAGPGGAPAEVDIASRDIQITGNGGGGLAGYLQIDANALDSLTAGSLLIGGTRTATTSGVTITPLANSVVVSNDAASSLTGPEILLVTKADASGTDPNAANGLQIDAGASIVASGGYPAAKDVPIAIAGDGALLRVSNGASVPLSRTGLTGSGLLTVGAGATLAGGQALLIDSSGNLKIDPTAALSGRAITVDGSAITFTNGTGSAIADLPGFVISPAGLAQFANADQVTLRSYGAMAFLGDVDATFGNGVDLSAGTFTSDGGNVTLNAPRIAFTNEAGTPIANPTSGSGTLTVNAGEIDLGTGTRTQSGFGAINMTATHGIVGQNTGTFDLGAAAVTLNAPVYLADTSSNATLKTTGTLTLNPSAGTALTRTALGGAIDFIGGTLNDNGALISAPAGNVSLEATTGNLTIGSGSTVSAAGLSKTFFDVTAYVPAGNLSLVADAGTVDVQRGSTLDFSGASGGGAAGSLTLSAPDQVVNLNGTLKGGAAAGYAGGSLSLNSGGAVNLDALATTLAASGINDAVTVRTNTGNLQLSAGNTLTANFVSLNADGGAGNGSDANNGNVTISGTIDASGAAGGEIDLFGHSGVDLEGKLVARATDPTQRGGTVVIGTNGVFNPNAAAPYNATYGYENLDPSQAGVITVGAKANIDVSGGLSDGTVTFRAPLLSNGTVNLTVAPGGFDVAGGAGIHGSRSTSLEAYAVWSTTDATTGARHFDGIVDPAGWYNAQGNLLAGTFTAQNASGTKFSFTPDATGSGGGTVKNLSTGVSTAIDRYEVQNGDAAIGFAGLSGMYFAPANANTAHETFYGYQNGNATAAAAGTLMGFVEHGLDNVVNPLVAAGVANASMAPGIELDNPGAGINGGKIAVLTNWNLGAGTSQSDPAFRFQGQAPVITLRADKEVDVNASLSDGFYQIGNPLGGGNIAVPALSSLGAVTTVFNKAYGANAVYGARFSSLAYWATQGLAAAPGQPSGGTPDEIAEYYALYSAYESYLISTPAAQLGQITSLKSNTDVVELIFDIGMGPVKAGQPTAPVAPAAPTSQQLAADPNYYLRSYLTYLHDYQDYLAAAVNFYVAQKGAAFSITPVAAPLAMPVPVFGSSSIPLPAVIDNTPSPTATAANPLPMLSASLVSGNSSTFRVVAGADTTSANPLALQASAPNQSNVVVSDYTSYTDSNGRQLLAPTMIRTGTGAIDVAASGDIMLYDPTLPPNGDAVSPILVPGVIYTAGTPAADSPAQGNTVSIAHPTSPSLAYPDLLVTPAVNPDSAGDITLQAQGNIVGAEQLTDTNGTVTGKAGTDISQFWWQWMQTGNPAGTVGATTPVKQTIQTSINFGAFDQGVMSVGGNVSVTAGGNISNLSVSLPTTWWLTNANTDNPTVNTVGGGNLAVKAGGDILSGTYFVSKGTGTISAGGRIGADFSVPSLSTPVGVSAILALQDATLDVAARQGANIGQIVDPSYIQGRQKSAYGFQVDAQGYSTDSSVSVSSTTGEVAIGTMTNLSFIGAGLTGLTPGSNDLSFVLPATVNLTAFNGGITVASSGELFPSPTGSLNLLADQSVSFSSINPVHSAIQGDGGSYFGLLDNDPASMPSPVNPLASVPTLNDTSLAAHVSGALHADDTVPARIYSLNGSIVDGLPIAGSGVQLYQNLLTVGIDKPALIQAGEDIVNLSFLGQNLRTSDITRIVAGRDIYDTPLPSNQASAILPAISLGGPGTLDIEAGRNIGPLANINQAVSVSSYNGSNGAGIETVGNANNPYLPHEGAAINVLFGVGPGVDLATFSATYIDPASAAAVNAGTTSALIAFVGRYEAGQMVDTGLVKDQPKPKSMTADQAWATFKTLPTYVQQLFAEQVLFGVLTNVGAGYNDPASPFYQKYAAGFDAINTLFPASFGYTANNLTGGTNGSNQLISTGDLDIRNTTIQTQQGGGVSILGPGGQALVGSTIAPPELVNSQGQVIAGPGSAGILTLEQGNVDIFIDRNLLLAQSRIFTEQGGDMTIWSSNGDINAGKGSKSSADVPAPQYVCDANHYCTVDARGEVTGAGIATLQSIPGVPLGTINLVAPRGTVDAGDAGIRAGNINVAALHVLNADNIQVSGKSTGIPVSQTVNTGALSAASSAASAASQMAQDLAKGNASGGAARRWTISVQVEGFGDSDEDQKKRKRGSQVGYDPSNSVSVVGFGQGGPARRAALTDDERARLGKI